MNTNYTSVASGIKSATAAQDAKTNRLFAWLSLHWRATAALVLLSLLWGYNWVQMKIAVQHAAPIDFAAMRTVLGAAVLFLFMALRRIPLRPPRLRATVLLGLLQTTGFFGLSMWALEAGAAGRTAILVYTMPFWVLLFTWPLLGERLSRWQWASSAFALSGLILILKPWTELGTQASVVLAILAGLSWGLSVIVAKKMRMKGRELLQVTAWQMAMGAIPLILIALVSSTPPIRWTMELAVALSYNVIPGNVVAWLLWMYVIGKLPAAIAGMGLLGAPLIGLMSAWMQLGEVPQPIEGAGMALVICGLGMLTVAGISRRRE